MRFLTLPFQLMIVVILAYWIDHFFPYVPIRWLIAVLTVSAVIVLTFRSLKLGVDHAAE